MPAAIFSVRAQRDLDDVLFSIARDNKTAALRMVGRIETHCEEHLANFPFAGRACDELRPGLRQTHVGPYTIFYRIVPEGVRIIRVLHGARDIGPELLAED